VVYSRIVSYVPYLGVKYILDQKHFLGFRGKCVAMIQEYDLEIRPT
jgi:hypothetical protein